MKASRATYLMYQIVHSYEFETIEEFYDYILSSEINGNFKQVIKLYNEMPSQYQSRFNMYAMIEAGQQELLNKILKRVADQFEIEDSEMEWDENEFKD